MVVAQDQLKVAKDSTQKSRFEVFLRSKSQETIA